jgi:hypothetical protein
MSDYDPLAMADAAPDAAITPTGIRLVKPKAAAPTTPVSVREKIAEAGQPLGFVSRETASRRKPGPKRREVQGKVMLTGPERVFEDFRAYCDELGGVPYWKALESLLAQRKR